MPDEAAGTLLSHTSPRGADEDPTLLWYMLFCHGPDTVRNNLTIDGEEGTFIKPRLKKMGFDERKMRKYSSEEQYAEALSKGSAIGGVDAVFDAIAGRTQPD